MDTIYLDDFLDEGIIREKSFKQKLSDLDWNSFQNKKVLIKGCTSAPVPTWAYLMISTNLSQYAKKIVFGEKCSPIEIYSKD
tara:strand:- start:170 stop:415 length:246 start_codon:yes stop_codon:yes gene_type:complete